MTCFAPALRLHTLNDRAEDPNGSFVLYWMIAARRPTSSWALQHAVAHAERLGRPLVVLEALRADYPWASARHHRFVIDGMAHNRVAFDRPGVTYLPFVEPRPGDGQGLVATLADRACRVVTDHWPYLFLGDMVAAVGARTAVAMEAVDGVGLMPLAAVDRDFTVAHSFRRWMQRHLPAHLEQPPVEAPLDAVTPRPAPLLPRPWGERWRPAGEDLLAGDPAALARIDVPREPAPVPHTRGGAGAAEARLRVFLEQRMTGYHERPADLLQPTGSGLSAYLHFGHIGTWQVLRAVAERTGWTPDRLGEITGKRHGWWGLPEGVEAFLDELVTWREAGHVFCHRNPDAHRLSALQSWAQETLAAHASDERPFAYELADFDAARTHDDLWNACQRQLRTEGRITNYLRMYWGKKILHWTEDPDTARDVLFELNNRYALDGRDPNSTLNLMWVLGLFDRAWGPVRPVFGKVRYMARSGVERKFRVAGYLRRYGPADST